MLGEHRNVLSEMLWGRAEKIINDLQVLERQASPEQITTYSEEQLQTLNKYFHEIKALEDI